MAPVAQVTHRVAGQAAVLTQPLELHLVAQLAACISARLAVQEPLAAYGLASKVQVRIALM